MNNKTFAFILVSLMALGLAYFAYNEKARADQLATEKKQVQTELVANKKELADLHAQKDKIQIVTQDVTKTVTKLVVDNRVCDIHSDVIDQLNKARKGS